MKSIDSRPFLKVAAAQVASRLGDIEANLASHLTVIDEAKACDVDLLLFPELSLVGHGGGHDALRLAQDMGGHAVQRLLGAAGTMVVGFGLVESSPEGLIYNSQVLVGNGRVLACHRKVALATYGRLDDGLYFARGDRLGLCEVAPGWTAAMGICNDLWQPSLVTTAMMAGPQVLLAPVSSAIGAVCPGFDNPGGWDINLRFNAMTWGCPTVMANRVGDESGLVFWGGSRILDAFGQEIARDTGATEQLVCASLDLVSMRQARFSLPTLRDARALANGVMTIRD